MCGSILVQMKIEPTTPPECGKAKVADVLEMRKMANQHVIVVVTVVLSTFYLDFKYEYVLYKSSACLTDMNACALINDLILYIYLNKYTI